MFPADGPEEEGGSGSGFEGSGSGSGMGSDDFYTEKNGDFVPVVVTRRPPKSGLGDMPNDENPQSGSASSQHGSFTAASLIAVVLVTFFCH